jgi:hypothetical protein
MKNLLDRAKPELKQAIELTRPIYPATMSKLEESLRQNLFISQLTYETMCWIRSTLRDNDLPFDFTNPWAYFEDYKK